jgi:hypothetical protein
MKRQASSNWPSSPYALAKNDKCHGIHFVDPVDRYAAIPEFIIWTASEAFPVRTKATLVEYSDRFPLRGALFDRQPALQCQLV